MGTFRRNRLVPLLTIQGNLETFNRNVMLPLSDAYRVDDEHYLKGRMVRELFEEDRKCMRPLPAADFSRSQQESQYFHQTIKLAMLMTCFTRNCYQVINNIIPEITGRQIST